MGNEIKFKATTEWMSARYAEMNELLFNGELGECDFGIFTSGRGSQGSVLGWFKIAASGIKARRSDRRLFRESWYGDNEYVNSGNFYKLCRPRIELNGHYSGTESSLLATLVHEMCHYYTYMYGYCPRQGHGREFREIGMIVSSRSNGMFTIQRLASAEEMSGYELDADMQAKRDVRLANRKSSVSAVVVFTKDGKVKLTTTSSQSLINEIKSTEENSRGSKVIVTNDSRVIDYLFDKRYSKNMRTWRYWSLEDKPWLNEFKALLGVSDSEQSQVVSPQVVNSNPKMVFSIKTSNGMFTTECSSFAELRGKLQKRFPNMSYDTITKLMNNKSNFRNMSEGMRKVNTMKIVEGVLNEFLGNEFGGNDDSIDITPNMDLGMMSPFEFEMVQ